MKIIDLAEKQLNNEILPKHIRYNNEDLYFDGVSYCDKQGNNDLLDILAKENSSITHLYDEVEIIEEDKKIEKIEMYQDENTQNYFIRNEYDKKCYLIKQSKIIASKFNELIDEINKLKEVNKLKEE